MITHEVYSFQLFEESIWTTFTPLYTIIAVHATGMRDSNLRGFRFAGDVGLDCTSAVFVVSFLGFRFSGAGTREGLLSLLPVELV